MPHFFAPNSAVGVLTIKIPNCILWFERCHFPYYTLILQGRGSTAIFISLYSRRGMALLSGAEEIRLYGKFYKVKAKVENIEGLSSHADHKGLIEWLSNLDSKPSQIFIVHGEKNSSIGLNDKIKKYMVGMPLFLI